MRLIQTGPALPILSISGGIRGPVQNHSPCKS
jgi:hypothetical protein